MKNVSLSTDYKQDIDYFNKIKLVAQMADNIKRLITNESENDYLEGITYLHVGPFTFALDASDVTQLFIVESKD